MTQSREFHLSDVLSITTGCLVSTRHIKGVYDILNFMTGDNLFTHQLPRACNECAPALLEQHPQLRTIDASCVNGQNWKEWLAEQIKVFGEKLEVRPLDKGQHEHRNPIEEAEQMAGKDRVEVMVIDKKTKNDLN